MKKLIGVIVLLTMVFGSSLAMAETKIGIDWSYGKDAWLFESLQSPSCENTVNRFSLRAETNSIFPSLENLFIGGELRYSMHKADEKPGGSYYAEHPGHDAGFREYGFNATAKYKFGWAYAGIFAGLSYWYERDNGMHNLGDSHCLGTWGPLVGLDIPISGPWQLRLEGRASHESDPARSDKGKNFLEGSLGLTYVFKNKR